MTPPVAAVPMDDEAFVALAARIGAEVLAPAAGDVDTHARFPYEAVDAMREAGMLGALVPVELGGLGLSVATVARATTELGRHCSSAAMVFAMHHSQVACLVNHASESPELREFTASVAHERLLIASSTTEAGIGGNTRTSSCSVEVDGDRFTLTKVAPVISYGEYADGILVTARRTPDSPPSDQVLVATRRDDVELERTSTWDVLGFRGTCSPGFVLKAAGPATNVLPVDFATISSQTMLPVCHVLWSSLWLGIASAAESKARKFVQKAARATPDVTPPSALRLAEISVKLQELRDLVEGGRRRYEESQSDPASAATIGYAVSMNTLKVAASTLLVDIVSGCLLVCGMGGYANASPFSLGRLLRDSYGAQLMVNNDRIHASSSHLLLALRGDLG